MVPLDQQDLADMAAHLPALAGQDSRVFVAEPFDRHAPATVAWSAAGGKLRRAPRTRQPALELVAQLVDRQPHLLQRVAVAQGDGAVGERLAVDRDPPRGADLILPPVAPADRAAVVVLGRNAPAQLFV